MKQTYVGSSILISVVSHAIRVGGKFVSQTIDHHLNLTQPCDNISLIQRIIRSKFVHKDNVSDQLKKITIIHVTIVTQRFFKIFVYAIMIWTSNATSADKFCCQLSKGNITRECLGVFQQQRYQKKRQLMYIFTEQKSHFRQNYS